MLLSKIAGWRPFQLLKVYSAWMIFSATLLVLVNAFSSLDEIRAYGFHALDIVLTFGFLIFGEFLEALALALGLVVLEVFLESMFQKRLDSVFRLIVVAVFMGCWASVVLALFHII